MNNDLEKYDELKRLIDYMQSAYTKVCEKWEQQGHATVNLRKTQICEIELDGDIYQNILNYVDFLNKEILPLGFELSSICDSVVTSRVKARNSIEYKIQNYKNSSIHEYGRVAAAKCLNDLFGVRIIFNFPFVYDEIFNFVSEVYCGKYKCIDSSKLDYRAVHLYLKESNYSFPWELQIWCENDRESNLKSHHKYKQEYVAWEEKSRQEDL